MIEYLEGKTYNYKIIDKSDGPAALADGWSLSPDEAEAYNTAKTAPPVDPAPADPTVDEILAKLK